MTQSNTSSPRSSKVFYESRSQERMMAIEISRNEEISGRRKDREGEEVSSAIRMSKKRKYGKDKR